MAKTFIVEPPLRGDLEVGTEGEGLKLLLGKVAEHGAQRRVYFSGNGEFVTLIIGKRGSGKSYTLGALLEGLATASSNNCIATHSKRRATLLLDPMGNFWTTAIKATADGPPKVRAQFQLGKDWGLQPEDVDVTVWIPAGSKTPNDAPFIREFQVKVCDLDAADIADLLGVNLVRDPQGMALMDAFVAVTEDGWQSSGSFVKANRSFTFDDLVQYLEHLRDAQAGGDHSPITLKALIRSLRSLSREPVFSGHGTPLTQLLRPGALGILMLPYRVGHDLRRVITRLLIRRILREREEASQIQQRLDVETLGDGERDRLQRELAARVPRTILALDEAQELLGDDGGEAREALEAFCLLGRNYGLSLLLATQRPTTSAISAKVRSQVDLYLIHRLLTQDDIDITFKNLLGVYPEAVRLKDRPLDFASLVRSLDRGQMIISGSTMKTDELISRAVIANVRPRVTMHGGEVS